MNIIKYGNKEIQYLTKKDKLLGEYIEKTGIIEREIAENYFASILSIIIGQQISNISASRVEHNLMKLFSKERLSLIQVDDILKENIEKLISTGLGKKKAEWIMLIAKNVKTKKIDFDKYIKMTDKEIIEDLIQNEGIGVWSAKMFCMFGLGRMNVISYSDFGIRKGMMLLYNKETLSKAEFKEYAKIYEPYATVASIYLWNLANNN